MRTYYDSYMGKYRKTRKMLVCEWCYEEMQSRGECSHGKLLYVDEDDDNESFCDMCKSYNNDILYMV